MPLEVMWAIVGLLLTIGGTFLEVFTTTPGSIWQQTIQPQPLGVTFQIGAVLLIGCVGGKNAATLSQIAYLILGLTLLPVFTEGGGMGYLEKPTLGYLLGFIPGAWVCGTIAFKVHPRLESLAFSCICGLLIIHSIGLTYLILNQYFNGVATRGLLLIDAALKYSIYPLPGQLGIVCAVTVVAYVLRRFMFY